MSWHIGNALHLCFCGWHLKFLDIARGAGSHVISETGQTLMYTVTRTIVKIIIYFINFTLYFIVTWFKICVVWLTPPKAPAPRPWYIKNFYAQPQKLKMCCLDHIGWNHLWSYCRLFSMDIKYLSFPTMMTLHLCCLQIISLKYKINQKFLNKT